MIPSLESCIRAVCAELGTDYDRVLASDIRTTPYTETRQCLAFIMIRHGGFSLCETGRVLRRDHTTVCSNAKVFERRMQADTIRGQLLRSAAQKGIEALAATSNASVLSEFVEEDDFYSLLKREQRLRVELTTVQRLIADRLKAFPALSPHLDLEPKGPSNGRRTPEERPSSPRPGDRSYQEHPRAAPEPT